MNKTLEADGIWLEFGDKRILNNIYIKCETGKITGLLGRNGCGKSSLMKVIYGSLRCEKSVRIDQIRVPETRRRPDLLLYLPQRNFIPKHLKLPRILADYDFEIADFLLHFPDYKTKLTTKFGDMSGGEKRLIELYLILCSKAAFVLLDEPFSHISPLQVATVKELLHEQKQHKGILLTDHLHRDLREVSDHIYILAAGRTKLVEREDELVDLGYLSGLE